jgi:hypothetical protein
MANDPKEQARLASEKLKELIKKGNVTKVAIRKDDNVIVNIPVNVGIIGAVVGVAAAPWAMLIAAAAAVGFDCTFELTKSDGTVTSITGSELTGMAVNAGSDVVKKVKDMVTTEEGSDSEPVETTVAEEAQEDLNKTAENMEQDLKDEAEAPKDETKDS